MINQQLAQNIKFVIKQKIDFMVFTKYYITLNIPTDSRLKSDCLMSAQFTNKMLNLFMLIFAEIKYQRCEPQSNRKFTKVVHKITDLL